MCMSVWHQPPQICICIGKLCIFAGECVVNLIHNSFGHFEDKWNSIKSSYVLLCKAKTKYLLHRVWNEKNAMDNEFLHFLILVWIIVNINKSPLPGFRLFLAVVASITDGRAKPLKLVSKRMYHMRKCYIQRPGRLCILKYMFGCYWKHFLLVFDLGFLVLEY